MFDKWVSSVREVAGISLFQTHSASTSRDMRRPILRKKSNARSNSFGARATGVESREIARAAGYPDVVAPPTFPVVVQEHALAQLLADPEAGIDFSRVVHGDQRFSYSRPVVAGDELTATLTVTSVKSLGGHSMVTADALVADASGSHVVTATSTLVVRGDE